MKLKYADRPNWARVPEKRCKLIYTQDEGFSGHIAALYLDRVTHPLIVKYGRHEKCIVHDGYVWLQLFPEGAHHSVTVTFDNHGEIVQWYFDIAKPYRLSEQGIPYFEDLYLDIVVLPNKEIFTLDRDELDEALKNGSLNPSDYETARREAGDLTAEIANGCNLLINRSKEFFELFEGL